MNETMMKKIVSYAAWPLLVFGTLFSVYRLIGIGIGPISVMAPITLITFLIVTYLEFKFPFKKGWGPNKQQMKIDLTHFVFTELSNQLIFRQLAVILIAAFGYQINQDLVARGPWILLGLNQLHPAIQILISMAALDLMLYWQHRLMHEVPWLWKLHSVHHSADGMSALNAIRNHLLGPIVTSGLTLVFSFLGQSAEVYFTTLSFIVIKGWLQHANVDLKTGLLDYLFMTPNNHRWHHSTEDVPGNSNFGLITPFWDFVPWHRVPFLGRMLSIQRRTFYRDALREAPEEVGIKDHKIDSKKSSFQIWLDQMFSPFKRTGERV